MTLQPIPPEFPLYIRVQFRVLIFQSTACVSSISLDVRLQFVYIELKGASNINW
jgi:hypothetical protein